MGRSGIADGYIEGGSASLIENTPNGLLGSNRVKHAACLLDSSRVQRFQVEASSSSQNHAPCLQRSSLTWAGKRRAPYERDLGRRLDATGNDGFMKEFLFQDFLDLDLDQSFSARVNKAL